MILIITHKQDYTADFVIDKLNTRNIDYIRFNCEDIDELGYSYLWGNGLAQKSLAQMEKFDSVWFRRTKLPDIKTKNTDERLYLLGEYDSLFSNIWESIESPVWLSHPQQIYRAENKLLQLNIAKKIGLIIPPTLVTNSKMELVAFFERYNENIVIKPIGAGKVPNQNQLIYTSKVEKEHIENIDSYTLTPCIYQKNIEKEYEVRVTIVGDTVFPSKVNSQVSPLTEQDWRQGKLKFEPTSLPEEINRKLLRLMSELGLNFGAIDLIKNQDNEYIFLEINPNGQWAWIEFDTGQKISEKIIEFLTQHTK